MVHRSTDTGDKLFFTDGNHKNPSLSKVIVFSTEYEDVSAPYKEMIYNEARNTGRTEESLRACQILQYDGFAVEHTSEAHRTHERQDRSRERENGRRSIRTAEGREVRRSVRRELIEQGFGDIAEESDQTDYYGYDSYEDLVSAIESGALIMDENGDVLTLPETTGETKFSLQLNSPGYETANREAPVTDERGQVLFVEPSSGGWSVARDADGSLLNTDYLKNELGLNIYDNPHDVLNDTPKMVHRSTQHSST